jgi:hypothetical protein
VGKSGVFGFGSAVSEKRHSQGDKNGDYKHNGKEFDHGEAFFVEEDAE